jgi:CheY-like chemotaxis protein
MPICDGYTATRRIREIEEKEGIPDTLRHPAVRGQVPVFAVSASLLESQKQQLLDSGFSGFILKPINFARLTELMKGAFEFEAMDANQYQAGRWERGGWLHKSSAGGTPKLA